MSQVFIQTDSRVIDVSKIAFIDTAGDGDVAIWFISGITTSIPRPEADALLCRMRDSQQCVTLRAEVASDWAQLQRKPKRQRKESRHV